MEKDNKLYLIEAVMDDTGKKLTFASYLKRDYIEKALVINLHRDNSIDNLYFSSNSFGTVRWQNGGGLVECHKWESEEMARSSSYLTSRYTSILSDGIETDDYGSKLIIPDILDSVADEELANFIREIIKRADTRQIIDFSKYHKLAPDTK